MNDIQPILDSLTDLAGVADAQGLDIKTLTQGIAMLIERVKEIEDRLTLVQKNWE